MWERRYLYITPPSEIFTPKRTPLHPEKRLPARLQQAVTQLSNRHNVSERSVVIEALRDYLASGKVPKRPIRATVKELIENEKDREAEAVPEAGDEDGTGLRQGDLGA